MIKTIVGAYTVKPKYYIDKHTGKHLFIPAFTHFLVNHATGRAYFHIHTAIVKRGDYVIIV